jgi:hypothetical protein
MKYYHLIYKKMYRNCSSCNSFSNEKTTCNDCCYEIMLAYREWIVIAYILECDNQNIAILDVNKTELEFQSKKLWLKDFTITPLYK